MTAHGGIFGAAIDDTTRKLYGGRAMFMIRFALNNSLLANLLVALVVATGLIGWAAMPREMFPVVDLDRALITTVFEGASPAEVESQITEPIEEAFDGLAEVDEITSTSSEGVSSILLKPEEGTDVDEFMRDARDVLDLVTDLPTLAEESSLLRLKSRFPVISMTVYGDVSSGYLVNLVDRIKRRLLQIPGVANVDVAGERKWELWVIVDPEQLATRGLPIAFVYQALRANLNDLPGGSIKATEGEVLLRGKGVGPDPRQVEAIVLRVNERGGQVRLGDVAHVEQRLQEARTLGRFNGKPSINMTINKTADASTIEVAKLIESYAAELRKTLPESVQIGVYSDLSKFVKERLEALQAAGMIGLILVILTLYLFLNLRIAFVAAMGIPVGFMFAVVLLYYFGYSLNMISMFAFIVVLGRLVDDSIIVTENIYRHMELGEAPRVAAENGAREIYWPVVASTATAIASFMPMLAIGGVMGQFIEVIPIVVCLGLFGSLLEAFAILPTQAAYLLRVARDEGKKRWIDWSAALKRYLGFLSWSMANRYLFTLVTFGLLVLSVTYAATRMQFELFGRFESTQFFINIEAPNTYRLEDTSQLATRLEQHILDELNDKELNTLLTNVGIALTDFNRTKVDSNYVQFIVDLKESVPSGIIESWVAPLLHFDFHPVHGTRERDTETIINALRERLQRVPGVHRLSTLRLEGGPTGADVVIGIAGPDIKIVQVIAKQLTDYLKKVPGAQDVRQDLEPGKLEFRYTLNERGRQLGLTQESLADVVRGGFLGLEVAHVTLAEERVPVRVIFPDALRKDALSLQDMRLVLPNGALVYLGDVATISSGRSLDTISRRDQQRLATLTAEVDRDLSTPLEVNELVQKKFNEIRKQYPDYELTSFGEKKEADESFQGLSRATLIALFLIFIILAALFKSLLDPLVVMFAIPYGAIGVIFGHALLGYNLQFLSLIGALALTGVVVNNSLLLIDVSNKLRAQGWSREDSLIEACRMRVRPILLTSMTTILGISPLIFFASGSTAFLTPTAVSLGFGLLVSTALTLIALPCFHLIADDFRRWSTVRVGKLFGRDVKSPQLNQSSEHP